MHYLVPLLSYGELFAKVAHFNLPHMNLLPLLGMTPDEFHRDPWCQT